MVDECSKCGGENNYPQSYRGNLCQKCYDDWQRGNKGADRNTGLPKSNDRAFLTGWEIAKMATVWPCTNCGHPNRRDFAKPGQQVIFDVCKNCGEMPKDMPTFIDDGKED